MNPLLLGIDPGFAHTGLVTVELCPDNIRLVNVMLIRTEKANERQKIYAADDNIRRAREIYVEVRKCFCGVRVVCAESMSFPRNAAAAAKVSLCWGVLAALSEEFSVSVLQESPQKIKKIVCGAKTASKEDIAKAVCARIPGLDAMLDEARIPCSLREHVYDAGATILACLESDLVKAIRPRS